jgi:hypothetical protein
MTKQHLSLSYYVIISALLVGQALFTVYQGSIVIGNGQKLTQLDKQKTELVERSRTLQQVLADRSSLLQIAQSPVYNQFEPVGEPLVITNLNTVASR